MKKLLAFDLDDTLSVTKSPISDRMVELLSSILEHFDVCIISGAKYEQLQKQIVDCLPIEGYKLARLHLLPTFGTHYYRYDEIDEEWRLQYAEDLSAYQKIRITKVLEKAARTLGFWEESPTGEIIEDRLSQVTYSGLGQKAAPEADYAWDPDGSKRLAIRDLAAQDLPDLELRPGGTTSVDVTKVGINKAYGMHKLMEELGIGKDDILFFGDKLQEGGNDYPVKAMGIESLEVHEHTDTEARLETILALIK